MPAQPAVPASTRQAATQPGTPSAATSRRSLQRHNGAGSTFHVLLLCLRPEPETRCPDGANAPGDDHPRRCERCSGIEASAVRGGGRRAQLSRLQGRVVSMPIPDSGRQGEQAAERVTPVGRRRGSVLLGVRARRDRPPLARGGRRRRRSAHQGDCSRRRQADCRAACHCGRRYFPGTPPHPRQAGSAFTGRSDRRVPGRGNDSAGSGVDTAHDGPPGALNPSRAVLRQGRHKKLTSQARTPFRHLFARGPGVLDCALGEAT